VDTFYFNRSDRSLGSFFEYSYDNLENFTLVAGVRLDIHNRLGTFVTPRLHLRYLPQENTIIRFSLGSGRKAANIFAENQTLFGTNRQINILKNGGSIYGLNPEKAWNYGASLRQIFNLLGSGGDITVDYYITNFTEQVLADWESEGQILFYNLEGLSRANSFQLSIDYNFSQAMSLRFAYKNYDVKTTYDSGFLQRPFRHKIDFLPILVGNLNETQNKLNGDGI
jgi:outer membrane receptor for ferrienterochelin and colicin